MTLPSPRRRPVAVSMIAAMSRDHVIGDPQGRIPWAGKLPVDLKRFVSITMGKPVILGRRTFELMGSACLPGRVMVVLSRNLDKVGPGCHVARSPCEALDMALGLAETLSVDEVVVAGGGQVYRELMPTAVRIYLTIVDCPVAAEEGGVTFPCEALADSDEWREADRKECRANKRNAYGCTFLTLVHQTVTATARDGDERDRKWRAGQAGRADQPGERPGRQ